MPILEVMSKDSEVEIRRTINPSHFIIPLFGIQWTTLFLKGRSFEKW